ncbi:MAG: hypothetical protein ACI4OH_06060 [Mitsuokella sp.]|uniref:hypothetical protein n=1 Tax=Mitsuokella sp. TaxID=2049034 RepID=UPI003F0F6912
MVIDGRAHWHFVNNNNGPEDGINDSAIETFSGNPFESLVRESIQNSLDQQCDESQPVSMEFSTFQVSPTELPGVEEMKSILTRCVDYWQKDKSAVDFFGQARDMLDQDIQVMRISDFNTTGLVGAENGRKGTPWYNLIKARGTSVKDNSSAGSFGIGKAAPFACSYLRTAFYASRVDAIDSYIGVSHLASFEDTDERGNSYTTVGTGYYSDSAVNNAILKPFHLGDFQRDENGLDIYVIGLEQDKHLEATMKLAVLKYFLITIWEGRLRVIINGQEINKDNLGQYISALDVKKEKDIREYYDLLNAQKNYDDDILEIPLNSEEYGKEFGFEDGECTLLLKRGDNLNRKIMMTRKTGMCLFEKDRISSSISFTGILRITGENMNKKFKDMEVPSHDDWQPKRCKVHTRQYEEIWTGLKQYLKAQVLKHFGTKSTDTIAAYGMDEFFNNEQNHGIEAELTKRAPKVAKVKKTKVQKKEKRELKLTPDDQDGSSVSVQLPKKHKKEPKKIDQRDPRGLAYKFRKDVRMWLGAKSVGEGRYSVRFQSPARAAYGKVRFIGVAEHGNYALNPESVQCEPEKTILLDENNLYLQGMKKGDTVEVNFQIPYHKPIMMEVEYYEAK